MFKPSLSLLPDNESVKLLQITDTHLFGPEMGSLLSVTTLDSFHAVVDSVQQHAFAYDAIIATGDISQDHSHEAYQHFAKGIAPLEKPCYWLPGNHDFRANMGSVLPSKQIECVEHVYLGKHWQMIMLDSQVIGVPHGRLSDQQLDLLAQKLTENPDRHSLILLHHHPVLVNSAWLDQHTLKDAEQLWQVIRQFSNVNAVVCGHVHQEMRRDVDGVEVIATPSTCIQFKSNSDDFALDTLTPGWRELELMPDGSIVSEVRRLETDLFTPDFSSPGY